MDLSGDHLATSSPQLSSTPPRSSRAGGLLVAVLVLVLLGAGAVAALSWRPSNRQAVAPTPSPTPASDLAAAEKTGKELSGSACKGTGVTLLPQLPMRLEDIGYVLPMGMMSGTQVTPGTSQRYVGLDTKAASDDYVVSAPGDGVIVDIRHSLGANPAHYRILIAYSCTFFEYLDSLTSLDPALKLMLPEEGDVKTHPSLALPVTAGQRLGRAGGRGIALGIWDLGKPLSGLLVPLAYSSQPGKTYAAAPIDYYQSELSDKLVAKYVRSVHPIDGKLDYDLEGKISGNWFLAGSNGEAGSDSGKPWASQISLSYDYLDPVIPVISLGNASGKSQQFLTKASGPDPAKVSAENGLVKYELIPLTGYQSPDGTPWDGGVFTQNLVPIGSGEVTGTLLMQLLKSHKLQVELVPGLAADQVSAFSGAALTYDRGDSAKDQSPAN